MRLVGDLHAANAAVTFFYVHSDDFLLFRSVCYTYLSNEFAFRTVKESIELVKDNQFDVGQRHSLQQCITSIVIGFQTRLLVELRQLLATECPIRYQTSLTS